MLEGSIMSIFKMYLFLFLLVCFTSIACFFIEMGQTNEFKEYVDHEIEIHGGLTDTAIEKIDQYNYNNFNSSYKIESEDLKKKKSYGEKVDYKISKNFKFLFIDLGDKFISLKGSAISHKR